MSRGLYPRALDRAVADELLPSFPAVMLVGPRGSGKSTSMTGLATPARMDRAAGFADTPLEGTLLPGVRVAVPNLSGLCGRARMPSVSPA